MNHGATLPRTRTGRRGFTLMEVVLATLIFGITIAAIATVMRTAVRAWNAGHTTSEIFQTARIAQDVLVRDLDNMLYLPENAYNNTFRNQLEALTQQYQQNGVDPLDRSSRMRERDRRKRERDLERGKNRDRDKDDKKSTGSTPFGDLSEDNLSPPIDLTFRGTAGEQAGRLSFARTFQARYPGDQDTWGIRRVNYFVRNKVLYRKEEDPFGLSSSVATDSTQSELQMSRNSRSKDDPNVIRDAIRQDLQQLYAKPDDTKEEAGQDADRGADQGTPGKAATLEDQVPMPGKVEVEEPLCDGVEMFKLTYGYFKQGEWVEVPDWDSHARKYRNPEEEDEYDGEDGHRRGKGRYDDFSSLSDPNARRVSPFDNKPESGAHNNGQLQAQHQGSQSPDDLPGYIAIQLGVRSPEGKGRLYSFTIFHSLPMAQENDILTEDEDGRSTTRPVGGEHGRHNPREREER